MARGITPAYAGKSITHPALFLKFRDHPRLRGEKLHQSIAFPAPPGSPPLTRGKVREHYFLTGVPWDHPRLRGEKRFASSRPACQKGSPPLTRGKEMFKFALYDGAGITPAYAGKSWPRLGSRKLLRDHPRLRGEKRNVAAIIFLPQGSPPLTRGKAPNLDTQQGRAVDHPRLRGEKTSRFPSSHCRMGSPPLTRGKAMLRIIYLLRRGITPAYAGKSEPSYAVIDNLRDHPRLRGEKMLLFRLFRPDKGSPPLTRGKDSDKRRMSSGVRITPAYAGKSRPPRGFYLFEQDHPRLRGEKVYLAKCLPVYVGSPPLTRGKVVSISSMGESSRITPAYAGKRREGGAKIFPTWDHPRLRGEKPAPKEKAEKIEGSPPLTRGKGYFFFMRFLLTGITPAYAGKRYNTVPAQNLQ